MELGIGGTVGQRLLATPRTDIHPLAWYLGDHLNVFPLRVCVSEILEAIKLGNLHAS